MSSFKRGYSCSSSPKPCLTLPSDTILSTSYFEGLPAGFLHTFLRVAYLLIIIILKGALQDVLYVGQYWAFFVCCLIAFCLFLAVMKLGILILKWRKLQLYHDLLAFWEDEVLHGL